MYQSIRGMRAPVVMEKHLGQRPPRRAEPGNTELNFLSPPRELTDSPENVSTTHSIGRAPVFAGVSNNESLWAFPSAQSPEASSDSNSALGQPPQAMLGSDDLMVDIDWDEFERLFPPQNEEPQAEFRFPDMPGMGSY